MSTEMEQQAREALQAAVRASHDAAFAAGLAYPFTDVKYSERRQHFAHEAQAAANEAYRHTQEVEQMFFLGDYSGVVDAQQQVRDCLEKAREAARLAMIDETDSHRCPKCNTHTERLSAIAQPVVSPPDEPRRWMKQFVCGHCQTAWRAFYSDSNELLDQSIDLV